PCTAQSLTSHSAHLPTSFSLYRSTDHRDLHSFPTRRSSDLRVAEAIAELQRAIAGAEDPLERARLQVHLAQAHMEPRALERILGDRKSTRLNSSHVKISYAVFCLKKKKKHYKEEDNVHTSMT